MFFPIRRPDSVSGGAILAGAVFVCLCYLLGFHIEREDTLRLWAAFFALCGVYAAILWRLGGQTEGWVVLGVLMRALLVFAPALWSDDVFRFIWDGRCWVSGVHPFRYAPDWFAGRGFPVPLLSEALYSRMNFTEHYTVYPPMAQAVFFLSAWLFPENTAGSTVVIKGALLLCEIGSLRALMRLQEGRAGTSWALMYALNPLVIMEGCGNAHFEVAALCFVLWGMYFLKKQRIVWSAVCWAVAIAFKLTPLMFFPLVWRFLGFGRGLRFLSMSALALVLLFAPLFSLTLVQHMAESLDLYFRQFQFNASAYYLVRALGFRWVGYDVGEYSGPLLGVATVLLVLLAAVFTPKEDKGGTVYTLAGAMTWAAFAHLSLAAIVHPWYVILLFGAGLVGGWRFPPAWTALAVLSYSHYAGGRYAEHYGWIAAEYGVLWLVVAAEISLSLWCSHRRNSPPGLGTAG